METIKISISLLILFMCFSSYNGHCQTEKGNLMLGGSIGLSIKSETVGFQDRDVFSFSFNPNISYAIIDRLLVGVIVPVSFSKISSKVFSSSQEIETNLYSFGPKVRYYFTFGDFAIFPEISYTFGKLKSEGPFLVPAVGQIEYTTFEGDLTSFKGRIGLSYFLNHNVGLEGILTYNERSTDYDLTFVPDTNSSSINFNIGFQIYFQARNHD